jgi:hypothetical protein
MKFLSNTLIVQFEQSTGNLLIVHPNREEFPHPLVTVRPQTYSAMSFNEAAEFVGSRVLLLIPGMREQYKEHIQRLASSPDGKLSDE